MKMIIKMISIMRLLYYQYLIGIQKLNMLF